MRRTATFPISGKFTGCGAGLLKRSIFLILLSLIVGAGGAFYLDRSSDFRPSIDKIIDQFLPKSATVDEGRDRLSSAVLEDNNMLPCFVRNEDFTEEPPSWLARRPLGPLSSQKEPLRDYPDLSKMPGLVKIEQILSSGGNQRHHCAATRVGQHWFVTANHCVLMRGSSAVVVDMIIIAPQDDVMQEDAVIVPVSGAICHSAWYSSTGKFDDDIALVYVDDVSRLNDVAIATLDSASTPLGRSEYDDAYFAGWGKNGENRFLQGGPLKIAHVGGAFIMADNGGAFSPCVGDSGGPLYVGRDGKPRLVGVLSSVTTDACPPYDLAFYVRVKSYDVWLRNVMKLCEQSGQLVCKPHPFGT